MLTQISPQAFRSFPLTQHQQQQQQQQQ